MPNDDPFYTRAATCLASSRDLVKSCSRLSVNRIMRTLDVTFDITVNTALKRSFQGWRSSARSRVYPEGASGALGRSGTRASQERRLVTAPLVRTSVVALP